MQIKLVTLRMSRTTGNELSIPNFANIATGYVSPPDYNQVIENDPQFDDPDVRLFDPNTPDRIMIPEGYAALGAMAELTFGCRFVNYANPEGQIFPARWQKVTPDSTFPDGYCPNWSTFPGTHPLNGKGPSGTTHDIFGIIDLHRAQDLSYFKGVISQFSGQTRLVNDATLTLRIFIP